MTDNLIPIPVGREILQSYGEAPLPTSSLYAHRSVRTRTDGIEEHVLVGVHVIFRAGHSNGLYEAFNVPRAQKIDAANPQVATRALLIACDTLEIHGELSLPECEVAIYARRLVLRAQGNINTTPLDWTMQRAADFDPIQKRGGTDGAEGRQAGGFTVLLNEFDAPAHESMKRFVGRGGRGQDAGLGRDGADGKSMPAISNIFKLKDTGRVNTFTASFEAPCVYATYHWHWIIEINSGKRGVDDWPTDGEDALKPGIPGSGGNGGAWASNQKQLTTHLDNTAGEPGAQARNVRGGAAGTPTPATHYDLTIRFNLAGDTASGDNKLLGKKTTKAGQGSDAQGSTRGRGQSPAPINIEQANAWLHPLQVESVLRYARDAFLSGARDEVSALLKPYERALAAPLPAGLEKGAVWTTDEAARWNAAQSEVASMLHRLRMQLDYFGNPAGYMPLLSLQATMRLYDLGTKDALRTLLLAAWVQDKSNEAQNAANAFGSAIEDANRDTRRVAEQLVRAEAEMAKLDQQLTSLEGRLRTKADDLERLRNVLFNEASGDLHQRAFIKFGIKMAAAICQAVPVGQPVLGTLGKLADIAADIKEEGTPDTLSKIGDTIKEARAAAKKAQEAKEKAKKKAKESKDAKEAKEEASAWAKVGDGLGPALSMVGGAIGALQVSEEEVEVELAKLTASNPKWNALVEEIRALNKDKARLFTQLSSALQAIGDGYARLAGNADAVVTMQQERNRSLGKLSVEANQVIAKLDQAARLSLQRSLYLMVKAYETTIFQPIDVDWSLDLVFDKITKVLKPKEGFDAQTMNSYAALVAPVFEDNKQRIKQSLLKDYGFGDVTYSPLEFGFTSEETAEQLEQLRQGRSLTLDPLVYGLILPNQERGKVAGYECRQLVFEKSGPQPPQTGNAIISLRHEGDGTVRHGEHLYAVRSDAPRVWSWTYHFSDRSLTANAPSLSALDLLNMLLESDDESIKQKLAGPPAWSDLILNLEFSPPLPPDKRPRLKSLLFVCRVESLPTSATQRVLDVRAEGAAQHFVIAPADLAGRGDGFGNSYRIYSKADRVKLDAAPQLGDRPFSHWDILDGESYHKEERAQVELVLNTDTLAYCRYRPLVDSGSAILKQLAESDLATIESELGETEQAAAAVALLTQARSTAPRATKAADGALVIRAGADATQPIIGLVPQGERPTLLAEHADGGGWLKVSYDGLVGYVPR